MPDPVVPAVETTPVPTTTATPWHATLDAEHTGHIAAKGWNALSAEQAAVAAVQAHRAAELRLGIPADKILRMPEPTDAAGQRELFKRLGAPEKPEDYDLTGITFADAELGNRFNELVRKTAFENNIPRAMAETLVRSIHGFMDESNKTSTAATEATVAAAKDRLKVSWGPNYAANEFVAKQGAQAFGVDPETLNAMEGTLGYDKTMEFFRQVGSRIGEDKYVAAGGGSTGRSTPMTVEMAVARKAELMADPVWVKRYSDGGQTSAEFKELNACLTIIANAKDNGWR